MEDEGEHWKMYVLVILIVTQTVCGLALSCCETPVFWSDGWYCMVSMKVTVSSTGVGRSLGCVMPQGSFGDPRTVSVSLLCRCLHVKLCMFRWAWMTPFFAGPASFRLEVVDLAFISSHSGKPLTFLISNSCHILNVVLFLLGDSPASVFYVPTFRNSVCSVIIGGVSWKNFLFYIITNIPGRWPCFIPWIWESVV
jgi:hypothetical protein